MRYEEIIGGKWKYRLTEAYCHALGFLVSDIRQDDYCGVYPRRLLILEEHYCIDGATCFPDFKKMMRAVFIHDALCVLAMKGYVTRLQADKEFHRVLTQDIGIIAATACFIAVRAYALITGKH